MTYELEIKFRTWTYADNQNLFDHQEMNTQNTTLKIQKSGTIYRNTENFKIIFVPEEKMSESGEIQNYEILIYITIKQDQIQINDIKNEKEPLQIVAPTLNSVKKQNAIQVREGNIIRIGKVKLKLVKVCGLKKQQKTHYEKEMLPNVQKITKVVEEFYSYSVQQVNLKFSAVEQNPACRYCMCKTIEKDNYFRILCKCQGSSKYIHENCLVEWIHTRTKIANNQTKSIYVAARKGFECEICKTQFPFELVLEFLSQRKTKSSFEPINKLKEYIILESEKPQESTVYIVDLLKIAQINFGRNLNSDIYLPDLSVSRHHCQIRLDKENKLELIDFQSKFGTGVKRSSVVVGEEGIKMQKGRTLMQIKKVRKRNFIFRFFCSSEQA